MERLIRPYDILLDAASGWRALTLSKVSIEQGPLQLELLPNARLPLNDLAGSFGGHALPRGVAIWEDEIFVADPIRHRIWRWRPCGGSAQTLPTIGGLGDEPRQLNAPLGLAISHRGDLVVADSGNRRLLLFTLPGLALRRILGPFSARLLFRVGLASGRLLDDRAVSDELRRAFQYNGVELSNDVEVVATARGAVWRLADRERGQTYQILKEHSALRISHVGASWRPVDVASGPMGTLYVADANGAVWRLDNQGRPDLSYSSRMPYGLIPRRVLVDDQGRAYVLSEDHNAVVMLDPFGRVAAQFASLDETGEESEATPARQRIPASRLGLDGDQVVLREVDASPGSGLITDLTVDAKGRLRLDGESAETSPYLIGRPPLAGFENAGFYQSEPLDSGRVGNPWHRVVLELTAPERTGVRLFGYASDVLHPRLETSGLLLEPSQPGLWQAAPDNTREWLIQSSPGRYLHLALALKGPGDRTPAIDRLYIYAHRESSLQFLPAAYQEDETSRHVLDRLLSLTDTIFGEVESAIEDFPLYLDPDAAPADFLAWLASWFDLSLEQSWSEAQRRAFVKEIIPLYQWRGTRCGLRRLLQLHANLEDPMPQIVEHYRGIGEQVLETWLGPAPNSDAPHHFSVLTPAYTIDTETKRTVMTRLIEANIPAHAHYTLRPVYPGFRLGSDAIPGAALGLDSLLGSHMPWRLPPENATTGSMGAGPWLPPTLSDTPTPRAVAVRLGHTRLGVQPLGRRVCPPCPEAKGDCGS